MQATLHDINILDELRPIIEAGNWAPSGDNTQPWRIKILSAREFNIYYYLEDKDCYNLLPLPGWVAIGMFIENASIAALKRGLSLSFNVIDDYVSVKLHETHERASIDLSPFIRTRSVNRYPYKKQVLPERIKNELKDAVGNEFEIAFIEDLSERIQVARFLMLVTRTRLLMKETFGVHKEMLCSGPGNSDVTIPSGSLGFSKLGLLAARLGMISKKVNGFLTKIPFATVFVELELDMIPALRSSAHFILSFKDPKPAGGSIADFVRAGRATQRFWLTLTRHDMTLQPWYLPILFSRYIEEGVHFTEHMKHSNAVYQFFKDKILHPRKLSVKQVVFTGRLGTPIKRDVPRSTRRPIEHYIVE